MSSCQPLRYVSHTLRQASQTLRQASHTLRQAMIRALGKNVVSPQVVLRLLWCHCASWNMRCWGAAEYCMCIIGPARGLYHLYEMNCICAGGTKRLRIGRCVAVSRRRN